VKASRRVEAKAGERLRNVVPQIQTAVVSGAVLLSTSPASALVDNRMNGDGVRLVLGVNEPILGWVLVGVFGTIWALYSQSTKELGGDKGDDSGMSL